MTNLNSILKSRDITLPTKVCLVKVKVFPVVMYGCESWTQKKAEHSLLDSVGEGEGGMIWEPPKIMSDTVSTVSPSICHEVMGPDVMIFVF